MTIPRTAVGHRVGVAEGARVAACRMLVSAGLLARPTTSLLLRSAARVPLCPSPSFRRLDGDVVGNGVEVSGIGPRTRTLTSLVIWVAAGALLVVGAWIGIALPLVFGVVSLLPVALLALAAAVGVLVVHAVALSRG